MSFNSVGSVSCSDVLLQVYPYCRHLIFHNLTNVVEDIKIKKMLENCLEQYDLLKHGVVVYYKGASQAVVIKRCKELKKIIPVLIELEMANIQLVS